MNSAGIRYSVIIPTYNEENCIRFLLNDMKQQKKNLNFLIEIIVADGNSRDDTVRICNEYDVAVISCSKGRGSQLRHGANAAKGEILIFLHADLSIPQNMFSYIDNNFNLESEAAVFRMRYDKNNLLYKFYSFFTRFDTLFSTFGDQGLVISRKFYNLTGGFKDLPIMEDVEYLRRVRKLGGIKKFDNYITASARRFKEKGIVKTQLLSSIFILKYLIGIDPKNIYRHYYGEIKDEERSNDFYKISGIREG